jgi:hypothetical protein
VGNRARQYRQVKAGRGAQCKRTTLAAWPSEIWLPNLDSDRIPAELQSAGNCPSKAQTALHQEKILIRLLRCGYENCGVVFFGLVLHAIAGARGAYALWMALTHEGGFFKGMAVVIFSPLIALGCGLGGAGAGYLASRHHNTRAASSTCAVAALVVLGVCFFVHRG